MIVRFLTVPTEPDFFDCNWLFRLRSRLSRSSLRYLTLPQTFVWQASLIVSGKSRRSASLISCSVLSEQFPNPDRILILQVEHLPTPPHALKCGISFLIDAVRIVSSLEISIFLLSGWISSEYFNVLCVPSQNGGFLLFLHPQKNTSSEFLQSNLIGVFFVFLCDPSQKGWFALFPQAHQKYVSLFSTDFL